MLNKSCWRTGSSRRARPSLPSCCCTWWPPPVRIASSRSTSTIRRRSAQGGPRARNRILVFRSLRSQFNWGSNVRWEIRGLQSESLIYWSSWSEDEIGDRLCCLPFVPTMPTRAYHVWLVDHTLQAEAGFSPAQAALDELTCECRYSDFWFAVGDGWSMQESARWSYVLAFIGFHNSWTEHVCIVQLLSSHWCLWNCLCIPWVPWGNILQPSSGTWFRNSSLRTFKPPKKIAMVVSLW